MKSKPVLACACLALLSLTGCVTPAKVTETASGQPEVVIATGDAGRVKAAIVGAMIDARFKLESDSSFSLEFKGGLSTADDIGVALLVGSGSSTNWKTVSFTLVPVDGGVRVLASSQFKAQLALGPVRALENNTGYFFNEYQQFLWQLKAKIEKPAPVAAAP
jgi:hypothetical protein